MTSEIQESYKEYISKMGKYYGYPECCIKSFVNLFHLNQKSAEQEKVHMSTGFIPCHEHAMEILAGRIVIEDLILKSRLYPRPFKVYREKTRSRMFE